jgi:hypothetical protein
MEETTLELGGIWRWSIEDPDGTVLAQGEIENLVVNAGLNYALGAALGGAAQLATWYIGLVDAPSWSAFVAGDTMASHAGWTENVNYGEAARGTWTPGAASGQSITNPTAVTFTCNTNGTQIKGFFLASNSTKSGTTGTLWSEGAFSGGTQTLNSGQLLKCTYTANAASS